MSKKVNYLASDFKMKYISTLKRYFFFPSNKKEKTLWNFFFSPLMFPQPLQPIAVSSLPILQAQVNLQEQPCVFLLRLKSSAEVLHINSYRKYSTGKIN